MKEEDVNRGYRDRIKLTHERRLIVLVKANGRVRIRGDGRAQWTFILRAGHMGC